ncbi:MAG: universal stress protein [Parvibaculum sp.]|nr:universal stress protein [Parvibaculum sp.]
MFKSIFIPTTEFESGPAALETALLVARIFDGHLDCGHVHPDPAQILTDAAGFGFGMMAPAGFVVGDIVAVIEEGDRKRTERSKKIFDAFCKRENLEHVNTPPCPHAPTIAWHEFSGREIDILTSQTRVHDLTVMGHPSLGEGMPRDIAGALLTGGGRPLLLAPEKTPSQIGQTIAIAWKDSPECARAVAAAMPFLVRARQVVLLSIAEHGKVAIDSVEALAKNLRWHNINIQVRYMANDCGTVQDTIIKMSKDEKADMLVMGGYGHSRMREFIFGGVTRRMLAGVELPVFMVH